MHGWTVKKVYFYALSFILLPLSSTTLANCVEAFRDNCSTSDLGSRKPKSQQLF